MPDEILKRDQNRVTVLAGVTNDSDMDITMLRVDPITKRLLVAATGGGGSAVWGSITGTLSDQTDLQSALDARVPYTGATANINLNTRSITQNLIDDTRGYEIQNTGGDTRAMLGLGATSDGFLNIFKADNSLGFSSEGGNTFTSALSINLPTSFSYTSNNPLSIGWSGNTYGGGYIQNQSTGTSASADLILGADNDGVAATGHFINLGINNSNYAGVLGTAGDGYLYTSGGHQYIGTDTAGKNLYYQIGGLSSTNVIGATNSTGTGMGTLSPTARFHAVGTAAIGTPVFTGAGLNDLTAGGTYIGGTNSNYTVTISTVSSIYTSAVSAGGSAWAIGDTFTISGGTSGTGIVTAVSAGAVTAYTITNTGSAYTTGVKTCTRTSGSGTGLSINITVIADKFNWLKTGGATTFSVVITGAAQTLAEGVTITFAAQSGHTASNSWAVPVTAVNLFTGVSNTGAVNASISNSGVATLSGDTARFVAVNTSNSQSVTISPTSIVISTTTGANGGTIISGGANLLQFDSPFRVTSQTVRPYMNGGAYSSTVGRITSAENTTMGIGFPAANSFNFIVNSIEHARLDLNGMLLGSTTTVKMGLWGKTPIVQPVTAPYTPDAQSVAYTGIDNLQPGTVYATVADLNTLRVAYENLRVAYDDLRTLVISTGLVA